jgi:hypothetical protein
LSSGDEKERAVSLGRGREVWMRFYIFVIVKHMNMSELEIMELTAGLGFGIVWLRYKIWQVIK